MTQQVKALVSQPGDLSSIQGTHSKVEEENQTLQSCPLTSTSCDSTAALRYAQIIHTHTNNDNDDDKDAHLDEQRGHPF